jgi:hypothetical protein
MPPTTLLKTAPHKIGLKAAQVYVTLGDGVCLGVNEDDRLIIEDAFVRMDLGHFDRKRLDNLKSYLDQLSPHLAK